MCCFVVASPSWQKKKVSIYRHQFPLWHHKGLKVQKKNTWKHTHAGNTFQMTNTYCKFHIPNFKHIILHSNLKTNNVNGKTRMQRSSYPLSPSPFDLLQKNKSSSSSLSSSSNAQLQSFRPNSSNLKQHEVHRRGQNTLTERPMAAC